MLLAPAQSAPHLLISNCFEEPLCDSDSFNLKKSASTNVLLDCEIGAEEHRKIVENLVEEWERRQAMGSLQKDSRGDY